MFTALACFCFNYLHCIQFRTFSFNKSSSTLSNKMSSHLPNNCTKLNNCSTAACFKCSTNASLKFHWTCLRNFRHTCVIVCRQNCQSETSRWRSQDEDTTSQNMYWISDIAWHFYKGASAGQTFQASIHQQNVSVLTKVACSKDSSSIRPMYVHCYE